MSISFTRSLLQAALAGSLDDAEFALHPTFGVLVPAVCPGIPAGKLDPRSARELAASCREDAWLAVAKEVPAVGAQ